MPGQGGRGHVVGYLWMRVWRARAPRFETGRFSSCPVTVLMAQQKGIFAVNDRGGVERPPVAQARRAMAVPYGGERLPGLPGPIRGIVAFDLDGTILGGPTICELLAQPLGRSTEMRRLEALSSEDDVSRARREMAGWYAGHSVERLCEALEAATWAPGAADGIRLLQERGIEVVIASITWEFAVQWFAKRLGISLALGTRLEPGGRITHVWPRDKGRWLRDVSSELGVAGARVAAVGDSISDRELLSAASLRFFVGLGVAPSLPAVNHRPGGNIEAISRDIVAAWAD